MAIKDKIDIILQKRHEKAKQLIQRKEEILQLRDFLESSKNELNRKAWNIENEEMKKQYTDFFRKIDTTEIRQTSEDLADAIDAAVQRFSRDYLSIATVGKERQGKSCLLQSIGGFGTSKNREIGNKVIPAFDAGSCTGAVSVIWNDPEMAEPGASDDRKKRVRAVISFRSREDFLNIVKGYIIQIDPDYLNRNPLRYEGISRIDLQALGRCVNEDFGNVEKNNAFIYLRRIVDAFGEIRGLCDSAPLVISDPDEIQSYVAMNNGKIISDPARQDFMKYLTVSRADIYCAFFSDVGKVRLVDTVGIGTTQNGAIEAMLDAVEQESDAVIVVTRPDMAGIQMVDIQLYHLLRTRFQKRDISKWLFYLINKISTGTNNNEKTVGLFLKDIIDRGFAVAGAGIIDSSDQASVQDRFMIPLLEKLIENLDEIDSIFLENIRKTEEDFDNAVSRFRRNLPAALPRINIGGIAGQKALIRGQRFYNEKLGPHLYSIVHEMSKIKDVTDDNTLLWRNIEPLLSKLDSFIPSPEEIDSILRNNGTITPAALWELMLHNVRTSITDCFLGIDNALEKDIRKFKNSLVEPLYQELRSLTDDDDSVDQNEQSDMVEWLKSMMDTVLNSSANADYYKQIRKGFEFLYDFRFNTRLQLIPEVRRQLYIINPICEEYAQPECGFTYENCGNEIHFYLTSRLAVIEDELRYHLRKLYSTPNRALYSAAEEFYDRLIFASERKGSKLTNMSEVWGRFFQEYSEKLCTDDLDVYNNVNDIIDSYNKMLNSADEFANADSKAQRRGA